MNRKLTKESIRSGQRVIVIEATYRLPTMKNSPWYEPSTRLSAYTDIGVIPGNPILLDTNEELEILGLSNEVRGVVYRRLRDGKVYSSYLGEFTSYTRLAPNT